MTKVCGELDWLRNWLTDAALPLWWNVGADRARGGFHEQIDQSGAPVALPHRARVIARQAFCYCEAGWLGWDGPWREAAHHALDYFRRHFVQDDATSVCVVGLDGRTADAGFDLYDQGFALLAYASGHRCFGAATGWRDLAVTLRATLTRNYAHPLGGFWQARDGRLLQGSNAHMHLFESALAWIAIDDDPAWRDMADGIAALCRDRFIEPESGALREFFAADWQPAPGIEGRIVEPGHQYEWAHLLRRWAAMTGRAELPEAARLVAFADQRGLDHGRAVAVNSVLLDDGIHDPIARLWPQCERLRAYLMEGSGRNEKSVAEAIHAVKRFLGTAVPGLWFDRMKPDGEFIVEPARATSLYHILGVLTELSKTA